MPIFMSTYIYQLFIVKKLFLFIARVIFVEEIYGGFVMNCSLARYNAE